MTARIALSAGHHNTSGGDATEKKIVGPVYVELVRILRGYGHDVRTLTPIGSDNKARDFPGSLGLVAQQVVTWNKQGWKADLFLEIHAESNQLGIAGSGPFVIYPDWKNDLDGVIRNSLGPAIAKSIAREFDMRVRGSNGTMSEKETYVGSQGDRLGIFRMTEAVKINCSRGIVEIGRFNQPEDRDVLMGATDFSRRCAEAIANAVHVYFGGILPSGDTKVDDRFKSAYVASGGLWHPERLTPGLPLTPAFEWNGRLVQLFERAGVASLDNGKTVHWLLAREYAEALATQA